MISVHDELVKMIRSLNEDNIKPRLITLDKFTFDCLRDDIRFALGVAVDERCNQFMGIALEVDYNNPCVMRVE